MVFIDHWWQAHKKAMEKALAAQQRQFNAAKEQESKLTTQGEKSNQELSVQLVRDIDEQPIVFCRRFSSLPVRNTARTVLCLA